VEAHTVAVRRRDGVQEAPVGWNEAADRLAAEAAARRP
jgi:hypothetical protein